MFYQSWGNPQPRVHANTSVDYRGRSLAALGPCVGDSQLFPSKMLKVAMDGGSSVDFCRGCSPEEVLSVVQGMVAVHPFAPTGWNLLGLLIDAGGNPLLGFACLMVARRLCEIRDLPTGAISVNIESMIAYHRSVGLMHTEQAVEDLGGVLSVELLEQALRGPSGRPLLSMSRLLDLRDALIGPPTLLLIGHDS
mmetsp:Transcript_85997/g.277779  ORF Transcript_85997/g.277779 Transcript_85997/m.277779 type:complete len:194 (-) Transcript_85997:83-664(-)|eukprot:CAMPEP_0204202102 /NCGR_PEP_ID=MMETSP0361-20130328/67957_1 /ASSEMBLY_ACC=CAM_ASM_000343 /TAXON_ID=268821 /ORGANISM="Scrippsiella Hangoei, Strain SHTV-5" /LENGTH=193 /DNA_ID=CAMNT_0051164847 /DNA_START=74 /DNA_END=655 /DNA_ORIENTATION=-